jgi:phage terminase small subunit
VVSKKATKKTAAIHSKRRRKLEDGILQGKPAATAARDAGYSESYARSEVYRTTANHSFQERLEKRRAEMMRRSQIHTDTIIGSLAEIATASLADVVPDDELLERARELGTDHLIKKLKVKTRYYPNGAGKEPDKEVTHEFEMYSRLDALNQLRDTFGMRQEARRNEQDAAALRAEVEKSLARIMERDQVDQVTAALSLRAEMGDVPALLPIINSYVS